MKRPTFLKIHFLLCEIIRKQYAYMMHWLMHPGQSQILARMQRPISAAKKELRAIWILENKKNKSK